MWPCEAQVYVNEIDWKSSLVAFCSGPITSDSIALEKVLSVYDVPGTVGAAEYMHEALEV